jgi:hypothetical protein
MVVIFLAVAYLKSLEVAHQKQLSDFITQTSTQGWQFLDLETVSPEKLHLPKNIFWFTGGVAPAAELFAIREVDGIQVVLQVFDVAKKNNYHEYAVVQKFTLEGEIGGWLEVMDRGTRRSFPSPLESNEFNKEVLMAAVPDKVAYDVFTPDLMKWYLDESGRPFIHIDKNTLALMPREISGYRLSELVSQVEPLLQVGLYIEKKLNDLVTTA